MGAKERRLLFGLEFSVISAFQCFSPFDLHWDWMDNFPKCLWTLSLMHSSFGPYPPRTGWGWVGFDSHTRVSGCRNGQNVSRKKHRTNFRASRVSNTPGENLEAENCPRSSEHLESCAKIMLSVFKIMTPFWFAMFTIVFIVRYCEKLSTWLIRRTYHGTQCGE